MNSDAILTVDLDALAQNFQTLQAMLRGGFCAAVVKADAYGLGATAVATQLLAEGCQTFFVATIDEGLSLRADLGHSPRIMILSGVPPGSEGCAAEANLIPVLNSLHRLANWRQEAAKRGTLLAAALQVDTGMTRLGMADHDVARLASDPAVMSGVRPILLMSHLACADDPSHEANAAQATIFERLRAIMPGVPASLANSSGLFLSERFHLDLARPGAALYGLNPTPLDPNPMRPVVTLTARVVQTRAVGAQTPVGYGHAHTTSLPARLAVLGIGYADGWRRNSTLGARFDGAALPLVGRVSMDSITVDASSVPEGRLAEGAWTTLIDDQQTVDDVAHAAGTIGYEILCAFGARVARRYAARKLKEIGQHNE